MEQPIIVTPPSPFTEAAVVTPVPPIKLPPMQVKIIGTVTPPKE